jgi:hypothetical protein
MAFVMAKGNEVSAEWVEGIRVQLGDRLIEAEFLCLALSVDAFSA